MKVAVCIITYQRASGLARLLKGIDALTFRGERPDLRVIVVDNDTAESGREMCAAVRDGLSYELEYYVEPRRGIPFARNTAVQRAGEDVDYIAFIDDDEIPDPLWLDELLRVMQEYKADVVAGPVVPHFVEQPPPWIRKGRFYDRKRWATGQSLDRAFTGNILLSREVFARMAPHFDERLALTGGSDSHFLQRVSRAGFRIVWADDAIATEWVPASRLGAKWIFQRSYRVGTTMAFIDRDFYSFPKAVIMLLARGGFRICLGFLLLPVGLLLGRHKLVAYARNIYYGIGMLVGLTGGRYQEYKTTHRV